MQHESGSFHGYFENQLPVGFPVPKVDPLLSPPDFRTMRRDEVAEVVAAAAQRFIERRRNRQA
jgi:hypothetical protein